MKFVPTAATQKVARQMLKGRAASPTILFGAGVLGMVGSTVLACRSTLKVHDMMEKTSDDLALARQMDHEEYSEHDRRKDITIIYVRGAGSLIKAYAPALLLGVASIAALTKSHNILTQRNLALTAAYAAVESAFAEYRQRVVAKYGADQDREFRYTTEQVEVLDAKGKIKTETRVGPDGASMYARFFDEYSKEWSKEADYNFVFLSCQQTWCNDMLRTRGHLFLNEVYDCLGLERSTAGSVVGWVISDEGDNFIDFGIFEGDGASRAFVNGREGSILLDFNVDGVIYDKIDKKDRIKWQS